MDSTVSLCLVVLFTGALAAVEGAKWSYTGKSGPEYWHEQFKLCAGKRQSPIDLRTEQTMYDPALKNFALWYDPPRPGSNITVRNNGHTLQVDLEGEFYVSNGGLQHVYKAAQFHFHWGRKAHHGSEHLIDGKASPIEMHLVTYNQEVYDHIGAAATESDGLAVLGTMFEISKEDNPAFASIVKAIKHIRDPHQKVRIRLPLDIISIRDVLPRDLTRYFRYKGSLTTPHCYESVTWTVFEQMQTISEAQLKEFRSLLQFRRHHHKHSAPATEAKMASPEGGSDTRQRRAADQHQKAELKHLRDVYVELGIKGNREEEAYVREATERMMSDMPADPSQNALEKDAQSKDDKADPGQRVLVNNYRPVQPINERIVYRSFKLRGPARSQQQQGGEQGSRLGYRVDTRPGSQDIHNSCPVCDAAGSLWASVLVLLAALVATLLVVM